jgi:Zn-dependent protease with chaperone function
MAQEGNAWRESALMPGSTRKATSRPARAKAARGKKRNRAGERLAPLLLFAVALAPGFAHGDARGAPYSAEEVRLATEHKLERELRGHLHPPDRVSAGARHVFERIVGAALKQQPAARTIAWALYLPDDRRPLAYATSHGKVIVSTGFLERYAPDDAQLALVLGHEVAHILCAHEPARLAAVRALGGGTLSAVHAIELLETEPWAAEALVPLQREQERVADGLGLRLAMEAGYAPERALAFFDSLARVDHQRSFGADEHDTPDARRRALERRLRVRSGALSPARQEPCGTRANRSSSSALGIRSAPGPSGSSRPSRRAPGDSLIRSPGLFTSALDKAACPCPPTARCTCAEAGHPRP